MPSHSVYYRNVITLQLWLTNYIFMRAPFALRASPNNGAVELLIDSCGGKPVPFLLSCQAHMKPTYICRCKSSGSQSSMEVSHRPSISFSSSLC